MGNFCVDVIFKSSTEELQIQAHFAYKLFKLKVYSIKGMTKKFEANIQIF